MIKDERHDSSGGYSTVMDSIYCPNLGSFFEKTQNLLCKTFTRETYELPALSLGAKLII